MPMACLCGRLQPCSLHRSKGHRRPGTYGGGYQTNRAFLMKKWNADPNTRCHLCGQRARVDDPWEPDHLIPLIDGGSDHLSNLRPSHRSCNRAAGARLVTQRKKQEAERRAHLRLVETQRYLEEVGRGRR